MIIVAGGAATAERLKRAVEKAAGYPAYVIRTPAPIRKGGCSYSVRVDDRATDVIRKIAREGRISYRGIYTITKKNGESVYNAIS